VATNGVVNTVRGVSRIANRYAKPTPSLHEIELMQAMRAEIGIEERYVLYY
jgi:hypothetical protein